MARKKTVTVFLVLVDEEPGWYGNGDRVHRFGDRTDAERFAKGKLHMGRPASVSMHEVPRALARAWGLA